MLHTKYECSRPYGLSQEDLLRFFQFSAILLPRQPEFLLELKSFYNFCRASPKEHSCQVLSRLAFWFWRRRFLKKLLTDGQTAGQTDGPPDAGQWPVTIAPLLCSGELKKIMITRLEPTPTLVLDHSTMASSEVSGCNHNLCMLHQVPNLPHPFYFCFVTSTPLPTSYSRTSKHQIVKMNKTHSCFNTKKLNL